MASLLKVDKLDPQSGTALEIGTSGDTITVPSGETFAVSGTMNASSITAGTLAIAQGGTGAATFAAAGLSNTPAWDARASANQTGLTSGGWTKVEFDTEIFDTDSAYDTTNDKFVVPSGEDGKYLVMAAAKINDAGSPATLIGSGMRLTVNGSNVKQEIHFPDNGTNKSEGKTVVAILDLSASDYVEAYAYAQDNGGSACSITGGSDYDTYFSGFKLNGV